MSYLDKYFEKYTNHHAHLIEGDTEILASELIVFLVEKGIVLSLNDPDLYVVNFDTLGIDDGRDIQDYLSKKPLKGEKKILILKTNFITTETQNSLLKTFEEPTLSSVLFLLMPSGENLLPTLRSRLNIIKILENENVIDDFTNDFLKSNKAQRLELIKKFFPKKTDEKIDKAGVISFLNNLEMALYQKMDNTLNLQSGKEKGSATLLPTQTLLFKEIRKCRSYLNDRSPSVKMILEWISLVV